MQVKLEDIFVSVYPIAQSGWSPAKVGVSVLHVPTNTEVRSDTERSQHANRHKAFLELVSLLNAYPQQLELDF